MAELIDRNTLLSQMDAQQQAHYMETMRGNESDLVAPSWELAIDMINQMPAAKEES